MFEHDRTPSGPERETTSQRLIDAMCEVAPQFGLDPSQLVAEQGSLFPCYSLGPVRFNAQDFEKSNTVYFLIRDNFPRFSSQLIDSVLRKLSLDRAEMPYILTYLYDGFDGGYPSKLAYSRGIKLSIPDSSGDLLSNPQGLSVLTHDEIAACLSSGCEEFPNTIDLKKKNPIQILLGEIKIQESGGQGIYDPVTPRDVQLFLLLKLKKGEISTRREYVKFVYDHLNKDVLKLLLFDLVEKVILSDQQQALNSTLLHSLLKVDGSLYEGPAGLQDELFTELVYYLYQSRLEPDKVFDFFRSCNLEAKLSTFSDELRHSPLFLDEEFRQFYLSLLPPLPRFVEFEELMGTNAIKCGQDTLYPHLFHGRHTTLEIIKQLREHDALPLEATVLTRLIRSLHSLAYSFSQAESKDSMSVGKNEWRDFLKLAFDYGLESVPQVKRAILHLIFHHKRLFGERYNDSDRFMASIEQFYQFALAEGTLPELQFPDFTYRDPDSRPTVFYNLKELSPITVHDRVFLSRANHELANRNQIRFDVSSDGVSLKSRAHELNQAKRDQRQTFQHYLDQTRRNGEQDAGALSQENEKNAERIISLSIDSFRKVLQVFSQLNSNSQLSQKIIQLSQTTDEQLAAGLSTQFRVGNFAGPRFLASLHDGKFRAELLKQPSEAFDMLMFSIGLESSLITGQMNSRRLQKPFYSVANSTPGESSALLHWVLNAFTEERTSESDVVFYDAQKVWNWMREQSDLAMQQGALFVADRHQTLAKVNLTEYANAAQHKNGSEQLDSLKELFNNEKSEDDIMTEIDCTDLSGSFRLGEYRVTERLLTNVQIQRLEQIATETYIDPTTLQSTHRAYKVLLQPGGVLHPLEGFEFVNVCNRNNVTIKIGPAGEVYYMGLSNEEFMFVEQPRKDQTLSDRRIHFTPDYNPELQLPPLENEIPDDAKAFIELLRKYYHNSLADEIEKYFKLRCQGSTADTLQSVVLSLMQQLLAIKEMQQFFNLNTVFALTDDTQNPTTYLELFEKLLQGKLLRNCEGATQIGIYLANVLRLPVVSETGRVLTCVKQELVYNLAHVRVKLLGGVVVDFTPSEFNSLEDKQELSSRTIEPIKPETTQSLQNPFVTIYKAFRGIRTSLPRRENNRIQKAQENAKKKRRDRRKKC